MPLDNHAWMLMPPTAMLSVLTFTAYFAYRIYCLVIAQETIQPANALGLAWFFLAIEFLIFAPTQLPVLLRSIAFRQPKRPQLSLSWERPEDVPTVDVIITCCGEDLDVLLDTVRATCNIDYPAERYRVFLSDDGRSAELRAAVETLETAGPKVIYTTREKPLVKDYKAGNLNHGLRFSKSLPNQSWRVATNYFEDMSASPFPSKKSSAATLVGSDTDEMPMPIAKALPPTVYELEDTSEFFKSSEYVVGLDADMIPERHILRALLPHMVNDPKMAMACPPQTFYDCPPNDPLIQTMHQFSGVTELIHDSLGHADCLGSGYIMRRAALEEIGGFPIESLSEDVCCSAKMLGAGWRTCFIPESLQHGSVPESYNAHVKQRTRWFVGHVQTAIMFKLRLFGAVGKHLTWRQRAVGMSFDLKHLVQAPLALVYLALPFTLLCGYPFIMWSDMQQLKILIRLVSVHMLCRWIHQILLAVIARQINKQFDVRLPSYDTDLEQFISPYVFLAYVRSFILPEKLGGRKTGFTSTGSITSAMNERSKQNRASLPRRLWIVVVHQLAWVHLLFILAIVAGVILTLLRCFLPDGLERIRSAYIIGNATTTHDKLIYLVTRLGWPPLFWLQATVSAMTPFVYAICPPTVPDREELLDRDLKTGIAYPKDSSNRLQRTKLGSWRYWRGTFVIIYTWVLLIGSIWL